MNYGITLYDIVGVTTLVIVCISVVYILASTVYSAKYAAKLGYMERLNKLNKD